jgi:putative ABC transport system ATP-binding protein
VKLTKRRISIIILLTIILVTHEHDIAQFAKRNIIFRDGKIRRDDNVANRLVAGEVLKTLPVLED